VEWDDVKEINNALRTILLKSLSMVLYGSYSGVLMQFSFANWLVVLQFLIFGPGTVFPGDMLPNGSTVRVNVPFYMH
jgi:hypothetical protein